MHNIALTKESSVKLHLAAQPAQLTAPGLTLLGGNNEMS